MNQEERKQLYKSLDNKTKFLIELGQKVERSHHTVRGWFSENVMSTEMPKDRKLLKLIDRELKKAPKKETNGAY